MYNNNVMKKPLYLETRNQPSPKKTSTEIKLICIKRTSQSAHETKSNRYDKNSTTNVDKFLFFPSTHIHTDWPFSRSDPRFFLVLRSGKTFGVTHGRHRPIWHLSRKYVRLGFPIGFFSFGRALLYFGIFAPDKGSAALGRRRWKIRRKYV